MNKQITSRADFYNAKQKGCIFKIQQLKEGERIWVECLDAEEIALEIERGALNISLWSFDH